MKTRDLVGLIPAAGKGTRLFPYPGPKELFPVGYQEVDIEGSKQMRPKVVSQYTIESMIGAGARRLYVIIGEHKNPVIAYYGSGSRFNADICYLCQERQIGMAAAVDQAYQWLRDETVLCGMPDTIVYPRDAFRQLLSHHRVSRNDVTLGVFRTSTPSKFGMVELNSAGKVIWHQDKPKQCQVDTMWGIACWERSFGELLHALVESRAKTDKEVVLGDAFDEAIRSLNVGGFAFEDGTYLDIGTSDEIEVALQYVRERSSLATNAAT